MKKTLLLLAALLLSSAMHAQLNQTNVAPNKNATVNACWGSLGLLVMQDTLFNTYPILSQSSRRGVVNTNIHPNASHVLIYDTPNIFSFLPTIYDTLDIVVAGMNNTTYASTIYCSYDNPVFSNVIHVNIPMTLTYNTGIMTGGFGSCGTVLEPYPGVLYLLPDSAQPFMQAFYYDPLPNISYTDTLALRCRGDAFFVVPDQWNNTYGQDVVECFQAQVYIYHVGNAGINESRYAGSLFYPDPSTSGTYTTNEPIGSYNIYDITGKIVQSSAASFTTTIYLNDLPAGIFLLQTKDGSYYQKLISNR